MIYDVTMLSRLMYIYIYILFGLDYLATEAAKKV